MVSVWLDYAALAYFFLIWIGYGRYAKWRAKKGDRLSLSRALRNHREAWAQRLLQREIRMTDASLMANQERVVGFFASTTLLLMAAVLTAITRVGELSALTSHLPYVGHQSGAQIELKLMLLLLILVYAFFKVTWALRQYGFASVLIGSAPMPSEELTIDQRRAFVANFARLIDAAGHDNNSCLRAYYFATGVVVWLAGTIPFLLATTIIALILANREFRSGPVMGIGASLIAPQDLDDSATSPATSE
jgi:uncharacterized membrane protein